MYKPRVYVETTIPSFYHTTREDRASAIRRDWTQRWWDDHSDRYELLTSQIVLVELADGDYPARDAALSLVADLRLLEITPSINDIVQTYARHRLMPVKLSADAVHLALASYHRCDFLLTWNCRHLANANKFDHIRRVNAQLGLFVPHLITPLELLDGDDDERT